MTDAMGKALDRSIERALERAQLEVFRLEQPSGDPPSRIRGQLGPIEVARGPSCWIANGPLPLTVADVLYKHPIGRREIRVAGRHDFPPPTAPWVVWFTAQGERVFPVAYQDALRAVLDQSPGMLQTCPSFLFHDEPKRLGAAGYIDLYHLDSDDSLQVFASTLRAHEVAELDRPAWWRRHMFSRDNLARAIAAAVEAEASSWDGDTKPMPLDDDD